MLFALTLLGCSSWIDQEPACSQDVYWWSDDLLAYVLTGDGSGSFEFDPEDEPRTEISGDYDPDSGDFDWREKYDSGFYLRKADVEGFGTVYHNGNLDLLFTRTVTDMLDEVVSTVFRVQRDGCDMTIASWDADSQTVDDAIQRKGSYSDESVWEWSVDYPGYTWQGGLRKNLSRTEQFEADDGSYWSLTTSKPDGESETEFTQACSSYSCEGTYNRHFDGTLEESYQAFDGEDLVATVTGTFDYDGSGSEHVEYVGGDSCDYTYESADDCSYECSDGSDGSC